MTFFFTIEAIAAGFPIVTEIEVDMEDIVPRKRRAWITAKASEVIKEAKKLGEALGLRPLATYEDIDVYVADIEEGIAEIVDQTVP